MYNKELFEKYPYAFSHDAWTGEVCCKYTNGEKVGSNAEIIPEDLDYPFTSWLDEQLKKEENTVKEN